MKKNTKTCNELVDEELLKKKGDSLIFHFHQIHNAMFRLANKKIEASSVPVKMEQLPVLMTLYYFKDQSQKAVADFIKRDKSSIFRTATALEKKGLLTYKKDKSDARKKVLALTETGTFVAVQVEDLISEIEKDIALALSDRPKKEFLKILKKASEKLEKMADS